MATLVVSTTHTSQSRVLQVFTCCGQQKCWGSRGTWLCGVAVGGTVSVVHYLVVVCGSLDLMRVL